MTIIWIWNLFVSWDLVIGNLHLGDNGVGGADGSDGVPTTGDRTGDLEGKDGVTRAVVAADAGQNGLIGGVNDSDRNANVA